MLEAHGVTRGENAGLLGRLVGKTPPRCRGSCTPSASPQSGGGHGAGLGLPLVGAAPSPAARVPTTTRLQMEAPGNATSATLGPLSSSTTYTVRVTCLYPGGSSSALTGRLTTRECSQAASLSSPGQFRSTQLLGVCSVQHQAR